MESKQDERLLKWATWQFQEPSKHIEELHNDLTLFNSSPGGKEIISFILALNQSVQTMVVSEALRSIGGKAGAPCAAICDFLREIKNWIVEIPPQVQEQRFGNKSFRTWLDRLSEHAGKFICKILVSDFPDPMEAEGKIPKSLISELQPYIMASFGDRVRIDYGTGHELTFIAFLYCLAKIGIFSKSNFPELVCVVFVCYLDLMRELQQVYWLEPAGSRGVWGLDDYQFLPFIFGSSQLIENGGLDPNCIHNDETVEKYASDYLYLDAIRFIKKMKTGPFFEYAPILNDISGVATWNKVNSGLIRMYKAEVLGKFPVVQHFLFGSLLKFQK